MSNENAKILIYCLHGKVRMLIVCHLSYKDSEATVHIKLNALVPTEHQYSHNATGTLTTDN